MAKKKTGSGRSNKPAAATKTARTTAAAAANPVHPTDLAQPPKPPKAADATAAKPSQGVGTGGAATPGSAPRLPFRRPQSLNFAGVGRNDICPCGSGKRFKNCHGH